jgi:hypothetical protein
MINLTCIYFAMCAAGPPQPPPVTLPYMAGNLSEYSMGVMDGVIKMRLSWGDITPEQVEAADVYAAVYSCEWVGSTGHITYNGVNYNLLVTDCANVEHDSTARLFHRGVIAEVDGDFAQARDLQANGRHAEVILYE